MSSSFNDKISVYLDNEDDMLDEFYAPDDFNLSSELEEYLIKEVSRRYKNDKIKIYVEFKEDGSIEKFKEAVYNTFNKKVISVGYDIKRNNLLSIATLIIGLLLAVMIYILTDINTAFAQFLAIACWVFIWYSVETHFIVNRELKLEKIRYNQLVIAEITSKIKYER
ncbi:hypothetical protein [Clostridium sardiniense]|uniref:hypothetical protein n=1 Tax=Clostridium sardiniense TaxID=29369 RepID=UPI003D346CEE